MESSKRLLAAIFAGLLLFFGGYYAGVSAAGSGLTVYMKDAEGGVIPASRLSARYFIEQLPLEDELREREDFSYAPQNTELEEDSISPDKQTEDIPENAENAAEGGESSLLFLERTEEAADSEKSERSVPSPAAAEEKEKASGKININTAGASELEKLPGIGEVKSAAIVAYREKNGAFVEIEELMAVKGIGEGTFAKIKNLITT